MNLRMHKMKIEHFINLEGMVNRMKLIKLPSYDANYEFETQVIERSSVLKIETT